MNHLVTFGRLGSCEPLNTFVLVHRGKEYRINPVIFSLVSRKIASLVRTDPKCRSFELPAIEGPLEQFIGLVYGRPMTITAGNCRFVYRMAKVLEIEKIMEACKRTLRDTSTPFNLMTFAEQLINAGAECTEEIDQIVDNYAAMKKEIPIEEWSVGVLQHVLMSPRLRHVMASVVINDISPLLAQDREKYAALIRYIDLRAMPEKERKAIIANYVIDLNEIKGLATEVLLCKECRRSYLK